MSACTNGTSSVRGRSGLNGGAGGHGGRAQFGLGQDGMEVLEDMVVGPRDGMYAIGSCWKCRCKRSMRVLARMCIERQRVYRLHIGSIAYILGPSPTYV